MKKTTIFLISILFLFAGKLQAQTMFGNTALTLSKGVVSLGVNADYATEIDLLSTSIVAPPEDIAYFFHLGYGTSRSTDIGINIGKAWGTMYYGLDFEKNLLKEGNLSISGTIGGHYWDNVGADADIIASVKIEDFYLTTGFDVDANINELYDGTLELYFPAYIPVELEFNPNSKMALTFEANIAVNNRAFTTVGAGVNFYFN
ncbi:MAG: hypothetical protein GXO49_01190 [Chlorobi bacterium]|nr:hypothetical protein [Chlorobiota bacterium]